MKVPQKIERDGKILKGCGCWAGQEPMVSFGIHPEHTGLGWAFSTLINQKFCNIQIIPKQLWIAGGYYLINNFFVDFFNYYSGKIWQGWGCPFQMFVPQQKSTQDRQHKGCHCPCCYLQTAFLLKHSEIQKKIWGKKDNAQPGALNFVALTLRRGNFGFTP